MLRKVSKYRLFERFKGFGDLLGISTDFEFPKDFTRISGFCPDFQAGCTAVDAGKKLVHEHQFAREPSSA